MKIIGFSFDCLIFVGLISEDGTFFRKLAVILLCFCLSQLISCRLKGKKNEFFIPQAFQLDFTRFKTAFLLDLKLRF